MSKVLDSEWREFKDSNGQVQYFNKITGITTYEKPQVLRNAEMQQWNSNYQQQSTYKSYSGQNEPNEGYGANNKETELNELFAQRNLNIPRTVQNNGAYQFGTGLTSNQGLFSGSDPSKQLDTALKQQLQTEQKDIYPSLNYFRTEEKQSDSKKFRNYDNLTKEDGLQVFKELLKDMGVSTSWKWEDAYRVIQADPRHKAIKAISERKLCFNEYINEMKTKERTEARSRRQQQRDNFMDLLKEHRGNLNYLSKYYQAVRFLQVDVRFKNIEEKDREELFQDFLDELGTKEREEKREQSEKSVKNLKAFFTEKKVNLNQKWQEIETLFKEDPQFARVDPLDRITAFEDYIKELERSEFQAKKLEKRRQERKNREAFQEFLRQKLDTREVTLRTKWSEFVKANQESPQLLNMLGQPGSLPIEIYHEVVKEENEILKKHKPSFKTLIKSNGLRFASNVSFEQFDQALQKYSEYSSQNIRTRHVLHEYYLYKVKQKEQEKAKKLNKLIKQFEKYLKYAINLGKSEKYEDYKSQIEKQGEYLSLNEETKQKAFADVVAQMKDQEGKKDKKRKSRSRSYRKHKHSSSEESGEVRSKGRKNSDFLQNTPSKEEMKLDKQESNGGLIKESEKHESSKKSRSMKDSKRSRSRSLNKKKKHF